MKEFSVMVILVLFSVLNASGQVDLFLKELKKQQPDSSKNLLLIRLGMRHPDFDSALQYFEKARELSKVSGSKYFEGLSLNELGLRYFKIGSYDSALFYWEKSKGLLMSSLNESNRKKYEPLIGEIHYRIAVPNYQKGNYKKALEELRSALNLYEKNQVIKGVVNCYSMLGNIRFSQGEMDLAESQFTYGIEFALKNKYTKSIATLYNNLASVYLSQELYEKAKTQYLLSIEYIDKENTISLAQTNMNIGLTYLRLEQFDLAEKYLLENQEFYERTTHLRTKVTWMNMLGELYLRKEDWGNAIDNAQIVLKELEQLPLVLIQKSALDQLSKGYEGSGQYELALHYFKKHKELQDSLFNQEKVKEIETLEAQLEFDKKEREISRLEEGRLKSELALKAHENTRQLMLLSGAGLLLLFGIIWLYYRKKEEKRRSAIEMNKVELEQRLLRSQMNPHFIFNALNSIQSYVATNKTYEAEVFLSKFSLLIRKILENSLHKYVNIEEEVETLKLYLELEKLRFEDRFDFSVVTDYSDSALSIPPMLLQPFVENAIIHGMKEEVKNGRIEVRFVEKDDVLLCEVQDNGVGRKLKSAVEQEHKSLATELINDRISYFNQQSNRGKYDLQITDLINEEGVSGGTRVNLFVPILS